MTVTALRSLLSPYVGIARSSVTFLHAADEARLPTVGCALADGGALVGGLVVAQAGSAARSAEAALDAAVGEAAERYAAAYVPETVLAAAGELDDAVEPSSFSLFHARQYAQPLFPFVPFTRSTRVRWARGRALDDGRAVRLPAQLVYLRAAAHDEAQIAYPTSNGLACGRDTAEAVRAALFEVIERDAFMIAWYARLSLPRLDWRRDAQIDALDRRYFRPARLEYAALDLSVFLGIPAVLAVVFGPTGQHGSLGIGAGCGPTVAEAWLKAMSEAFAVRRWSRDLALARTGTEPVRREDIVTFEDHVAYYLQPERVERVRFLVESRDCIDVREIAPLDGSSGRDHVDAMSARLAALGARAYAFDVTSPDVREAGVIVARVVVPELVPLDVLESARYLGSRRLYHAAHEAGLLPAPLAFDDLNPDPHPFP